MYDNSIQSSKVLPCNVISSIKCANKAGKITQQAYNLNSIPGIHTLEEEN